MEYYELCNEKVSRLGFGCMRFPCFENGEIDEEQVFKMVDYALKNGVNYFDTAYPYHGGKSELVIGKALSKYPRDSFFLADKYPGHQIADEYNPEKTFEEQLQKCKVDYFDFYLLHNVYEVSYKYYTDEKLGFVDYFVKQKKAGRIKHLGFSTHADFPTLTKFLHQYDGVFDFVQIQLNYLDWTMQKGKEKYEYLLQKNLPVIVMEPLRGGKLCSLPDDVKQSLSKVKPELSDTAWSFDFLRSLSNVSTILSGMSSYEQTVDNINIFNNTSALESDECETVLAQAEKLKKGVPCTDCHYCQNSCLMKLDIPFLIRQYNDLCFDPRFTVSMKLEGLPEHKLPGACIGCHRCEMICPQKIDISGVLKELSKKLDELPKWSQICAERNAACKNAK